MLNRSVSKKKKLAPRLWQEIIPIKKSCTALLLPNSKFYSESNGIKKKKGDIISLFLARGKTNFQRC